ncbi:hypothetical protein [Sphaerisporangium rhizosphaerae]|uniref:Uncharacterized protein n=1 Tax=Sphaerisporangium rhizosphaerae TaxID=2269375 RepID=A0ABW2PEW1_9ACTN
MMDPLFDTRYVERLRFFDGQPLDAEDLQSLEEFNRELRWLHNRSLHQPGIGNGLAARGDKGDRQVLVQAGYALNAAGQELVLTGTHHQPVPSVGGDEDGGPAVFDLVISYPPDEDLDEAEVRDGICAPRGAVRLRERPRFDWVRLRRDPAGGLRPVDDAERQAVQAGELIVLARAQVRDCALAAPLSVVPRRSARPPQRPRVVCGTVAAEWRWSPSPPAAEASFAWIETRIDTRAAGFARTPCYQARLAGPRPLLATWQVAFETTATLALMDGVAYVQEPAVAGFRCRVPLLTIGGGFTTDALQPVLDAAKATLGVTWLGIED